MKRLILILLATSLPLTSCGSGPAESDDSDDDGTASGGVGTGDPSGGAGGTASGGASAGGSDNSSGGFSAVGGSGPDGSGGAPPVLTKGACTLGAGDHVGMGRTEEQYVGANVTRDEKNYRMITNGWGQNWDSHDISWLGTTLDIHDYEGDRQTNGAPAGYPSVFCGRYSDTSLPCGLPRPLADVQALNTAASWSHPNANGTYNVAYDVWFGNSGSAFGLQSYFMVWLHDPENEGPAGSPVSEAQQISVTGAPGLWNIIAGTVNSLPIVNYVRAEGDDVHAIAFDIMDFIRDAQVRGLNFPGNDVLAIAIGFEIWKGPVTGLSLDDFCIDIQ